MKTKATTLVLLFAGLVSGAAQAGVTDAVVPGMFLQWPIGATHGVEDRGLRVGARLDYGEAQKNRLIAAREVLDDAPTDAASLVFYRQRMPALLQFDIGPSAPALLSAQGHDLLARPGARLGAADGSTWFGRNWGWVLGGVAVTAGAIAAGGGGGGVNIHTEHNDTNDNSSGDSGSGGAVCVVGSTCAVHCPNDGSVAGCKP